MTGPPRAHHVKVVRIGPGNYRLACSCGWLRTMLSLKSDVDEAVAHHEAGPREEGHTDEN